MSRKSRIDALVHCII